jgi:hypothetical protein
MFFIFFLGLGIYQDIINKYQEELTRIFAENTFIKHMKVAGALASPNDTTTNS